MSTMPDPCDWCAGYATALRDIAGWITDDIADGLFEDRVGPDAARSIADRLRDQAGRAALEAAAHAHPEEKP